MYRQFLYPLVALLLVLQLPLQAQIFVSRNGRIIASNGKLTGVTGHVRLFEAATNQSIPIGQASIQAMCLEDSTLNLCGMTDEKGDFTAYVFQERGKQYELHISYLGTETYKRKLTSARMLVLDTIVLREKPITLEEAVIVAKLKKMRILGDTTIFNTDAFKVSEGAVLLELVRKMPGLRLKDGKMTYQGKDISEIMLNGEKFFANDITIALQNMPVNVLKEVRIYDKKSERAEQTGIDDGERTTVMDLKTKKDINKAWMANTSAGGGDHGLYGINAMVNRFESGGNHAAVIAKQYNTPNDFGVDMIGMGMTGTFRFNGGGNPKSQLNRNANASIGHQIKGIRLTGDVSYDNDRSEQETYTVSESYLPSGNTYSDASSLAGSRSNRLNTSLYISGKVDERTRIYGSFRYGASRNDNLNENKNASFSRNPYDFATHPLDNEEAVPLEHRINRIDMRNLSNGETKDFNGDFSIVHNLKKEKRYVELSADLSNSSGDSRNFERSFTRYYQLGDSLLYQHRYTHTPNHSNSWQINTAYNEPITQEFSIGASYSFKRGKDERDENIYDIGRLLDADAAVGTLPDGHAGTRIDSLSNWNNTVVTGHDISLMATLQLDNGWHFRAMAGFTPERQHIRMLRDDLHVDTTFHFKNYSGSLGANYNKKKTSFNFHYDISTNSPGTSSLLPLTNNSNPLYITVGNPHLKSSLRHYMNLNLRVNQIWLNMHGNQEFNAIAHRTDYNPVTGVRTTYMDNINGNWEIGTWLGFSKDWEVFSLESETRYSHRNNASYVMVGTDNFKNKVRDDTYRQMLKGSYSPEWGELSLTADADFNHTQSNLETSSNSFNKTYSFLAEAILYLPFNIQFNTNFHCIVRHGFLSDEMNHSELQWNANVSYSFLKKKQANVKFEIFDILQRATNFNARVNETGSVQTRSQGINSYFLLSFNYRFNLFGGKKTDEG